MHVGAAKHKLHVKTGKQKWEMQCAEPCSNGTRSPQQSLPSSGRDEVDVVSVEVKAAREALIEAQQRLEVAEKALVSVRCLRIMIVGFGNFGQFLAKTFLRMGHKVIGYGRSDYTTEAREMGADYSQDVEQALAHDPHVVIICTAILATSKVLSNFPCDRLADRLVVDVLSVKEYPKELLLSKLPASADILCTHPMFGPQSGKNGWQNLPFVYERIRANSHRGRAVMDEFLNIFETAGCKMVEMSCEDHDSHAAATQFITHTTGRVLAELSPKSTPINTKGYESLLALVEGTTSDSFDLYSGLFYFNDFSKEQLDKLEGALKNVRAKLESFEAKQVMEDADAAKWRQSPAKRQKLEPDAKATFPKRLS